AEAAARRSGLLHSYGALSQSREKKASADLQWEHKTIHLWLAERLTDGSDPLHRALVCTGGERLVAETIRRIRERYAVCPPMRLFRRNEAGGRETIELRGEWLTEELIDVCRTRAPGPISHTLAARAANYHLAVGNRVAASQAVETACRIAAKAEPQTQLETLMVAAHVHREIGLPERAIEFCQQAFDVAQPLLSSIATPEAESTFLNHHMLLFETMQDSLVELLGRAPDDRLAAKLLVACERPKGYLVRHLALERQNHAAPPEGVAEKLSTFQELHALTHQIAESESELLRGQDCSGMSVLPVLDAPQSTEAIDRMDKLVRLRRELRTLENPHMPDSSLPDPARITESLRRLRNPGNGRTGFRRVLLIEIVPRGDRMLFVGLGDDGRAALRVSSDGVADLRCQLSAFVHSKSRKWEELAPLLRKAIAAAAPAANAFVALGKDLGVRADTDEDVLVYLVPHGWATHLPWHVVKPDIRGYPALGDVLAVSYLPTAGLIGSPPVPLARASTAMAVNLHPELDGTEGREPSPQLSALCEVLGRAQLDLDADQTSNEAVLNLLESCRGGTVLLAFHGVFLPRHPFLSHLLINGHEILTADAVLRNGGLDLDLLVLLACKTALSVSQPGDDLLGFAQSSLVAGARSVVAAQFNIPLYPTLVLAHEFLQRVVHQGQDKARALRDARRMFRDQPRKLGWDESCAENWAAEPFCHGGLILMGGPY
ncbi:MAG: CHAT domain-containing protein, partial [Deltaproteobacteria bacterium]|nr:CHAT domain-containing protein [Deltaproteobacteria bacterium]